MDRTTTVRPYALPLFICIVFSMLPDMDSALGIIAGDFGKYHNNGIHSLVVGAAISLLTVCILWWVYRTSIYKLAVWYLALFISYSSHVILDYFTLETRGVMLLWPLSPVRYESPVKFFYGVRWSYDLISVEHLWTIVSEIAFVGFLVIVIRWIEGRRLAPERKRDDSSNGAY